MKLTYIIAYVADMTQAVGFYRDVMKLKLRFESPDWSEFDTGSTTLALHAASATHPDGTMGLGFAVEEVQAFMKDVKARGYRVTREPKAEHGMLLAAFADASGAEYSVSGPLPR